MNKHLLAAVLVGVLIISAGIVINSKAAAVTGGGQNNINISISDPSTQIPICLNRGKIPKDENHWLYIPKNPIELATYENLGFLSGQLLRGGKIDASNCPNGGVWDTGYANPCGLDATRDAAFYLQNVYDKAILDQVENAGVPPVLIKRLIRYESQFWPGTINLYQFGLGHVSFTGAYTALQWNPALYDDVCQGTYQNSCNYDFFQAPADVNKLLSGNLLSLMYATCRECQYGIDIEKAEKSITYIAEVLMGYCSQTSQIVANVSGMDPNVTMDYATIWKLTVYSYNMGPNCLYDALISSYDTVRDDAAQEMNWGLISSFLNSSECVQGKSYVENIIRPYYDFPYPKGLSRKSHRR